MKNHWLNRKKEREQAFAIPVPPVPEFPPIIVNWGSVPTNISVTVTCPGPCSTTWPVISFTPPPSVPVLSSVVFNTPLCCSTTAPPIPKEINATQVNEGVTFQLPAAGDVRILPGEEQKFGGTEVFAGFGTGY